MLAARADYPAGGRVVAGLAIPVVHAMRRPRHGDGR